MSTVWCAGSGLVVVLLVSVRTVSLSAGSLIGPNVGQGEGVVLGGVKWFSKTNFKYRAK